MLTSVHRLAISRLAAAALALSLSGAVRVAAAQDSHEGGHRCTCPIRGGVHDCSCPKCHQAAQGPSAEELAKLPPCHQALYAARAAKKAPPPSPRTDRDCASPLCGLPDGRLEAAPTTDTFLVPEPPHLALAAWAEPLRAVRPAGATATPAPERPPPRA